MKMKIEEDNIKVNHIREDMMMKIVEQEDITEIIKKKESRTIILIQDGLEMTRKMTIKR